MKRFPLLVLALLLAFTAFPSKPSYAQSEPYIGQLMLVGFNFCPRGWAPADGALLDIAQNTALFSLLGTIYGGDGRTTFGLPDLRGRAPIHTGQGPGLSNYPIGSSGGAEAVTLTPQEMPVHNHTITDLQNANGTDPGLVIRDGSSAEQVPTSNAGGGEAHENRPPYLTMNWCIALVGVFPSRN